LFDLDGTLLNRDASVKQFIEWQYHRLHEWLGHIPKELYISRFTELDAKGYVWKDKVYQQLVQEFNINITWKLLLQDYIDEFQYSCIPLPNLFNMIESLKSSSYRLGIITNGKGLFQMKNMKALGIVTYFDTILVSEWEGIKKPNPDIFRRALKRMKVSPHESLYVGDHPENDVQGAQAVGMYGVWKKDNYRDSVGADFVIDDLSELPMILEKLNG
jgi:putative hydrolase of the HAD superfamily